MSNIVKLLCLAAYLAYGQNHSIIYLNGFNSFFYKKLGLQVPKLTDPLAHNPHPDPQPMNVQQHQVPKPRGL